MAEIKHCENCEHDLKGYWEMPCSQCSFRKGKIELMDHHKPKEPMVLSDREVYNKALGREKPSPSGFELLLIEKSRENGQLREWLRPEQVKLRETIEVLKKCNFCVPGWVSKHICNIFEALENLKPPYEQDNE